nr:unnamed protein product [Callosobruchus analis]
MSYENREDKDKLQTPRLRISSSNVTSTSTSSDLNECQSARQGAKRPYYHDNSFERKRYLGLSKNIPESVNLTKNLVNNRLQRLKQSLQSDSVQSTSQHENGIKSTNNINSSREYVLPRISPPVHNNSGPVVNATSPPVVRKSTNIYENLAKWSTPKNHNGKNLANNRLKKLKNYVLSTAYETSSIPTPTCSSPKYDYRHEVDNSTHKTLLIRSREVGAKRKASDCINDPYPAEPPQKKIYLIPNSVLPKVQKIDNDQKDPSDRASNHSLSKRTVNCNKVAKDGIAPSDDLNTDQNTSLMLNTSASSTYHSNKIRRNSTNLVGDKTPEKGCSMMSPPIVISKSPGNSANTSSPLSHKNSTEKQSTSQENTSNIKIISNVIVNKLQYTSTNDDNEGPAKLVTSVFKPFTPTVKKDSFIQNPLMTDQDIDSYHGKMAWTASWIEYHTNPDIQKEPAVAPIEAVQNNEEKVGEPVEDMEWSNAEPDEEILPVKPISIKDKPPKLKDICVVVDTNIFITNLSKVKEIVSMKSNGNIKPVVYIPWMVIQELDFIKDTCSKNKLKSNVMNSISFINKRLQEQDPRVIGQTVWEVENQKHVGSTPDDKIISCCMQVSNKYETVILLSNDMNLKNKALINSITACSVQEISSKINDKLANNRKVKFMMQKMGILCSSVICECARDTYGTTWNKMHMLSDAPWSFTECLKRISKYWKTVFQDRIMKHGIKTCDDLYKLIKCNKSMADDSKEFLRFTELCITLCVFFKDIEEYRESVQKTLDDIKNLE